MKKFYLITLVIGLAISSNAQAWFFFWIPMGGAKPSSTSPITSDSPAPQQPSQNSEPQKLEFQTPVKEEKSSPAILAEPASNKAPYQQSSFKTSGEIQSVGAKKLLELKSLLDQGLINQKDYDQKKSEILRSM